MQILCKYKNTRTNVKSNIARAEVDVMPSITPKPLQIPALIILTPLDLQAAAKTLAYVRAHRINANLSTLSKCAECK